MSIRNLDAIFHPKSVALIGASPRPHSVGLVAAQNLLEGGFSGAIMPVTPSHDAVAGMLAYRDVASLPMTPDLAVICTPPETVPDLIVELAARGTKAAIVITAGFMELGTAHGKALQQAMLDAAQPHLLRIVGPNCLGVLSTPAGLNASFAPVAAKKGGVAFVAQSGAMLTTVLDWASARGIGFSHLVSLGDMMDVDFGDMLDYLANDDATTSILLYIETITEARKFMSAARAAARLKPVIAIKAGRHAAAAKAATSHTGAMAGVDAVYDAAFERAGILRVRDLDEIFDAVETLAQPVKLSGDGLIIVTNGGGLGVLATDSLLDRGGRMADLAPEIHAKLDAALPPTWSHGNPVDIIGDATPARYAAAMTVLLDTPADDFDSGSELSCRGRLQRRCGASGCRCHARQKQAGLRKLARLGQRRGRAQIFRKCRHSSLRHAGQGDQRLHASGALQLRSAHADGSAAVAEFHLRRGRSAKSYRGRRRLARRSRHPPIICGV